MKIKSLLRFALPGSVVGALVAIGENVWNLSILQIILLATASGALLSFLLIIVFRANRKNKH